MNSGEVVWVVTCIDDDGEEVRHIFSTSENAHEFMEADHRSHILYDYVVDCPERHERPMQ